MPIAALVMLAVFALVIAGIFAVVRHAKRVRNQQREQWRASASALGLNFHPGPHSARKIHGTHYLPRMYGQYDGQDVYVGVRTYTTGSGKNRTTHYRTFVDVLFEPALARGLRVERAGSVSKFFGDVFGQADIQVGDAAFDRDFRLKGFAPAQIAGLFADPSLRAALAADAGAFVPNADDARVRFEAATIVTEAGTLSHIVPAAVDVYRKLLTAWHALPNSKEEAQVAPAWEATATRCKLAYQARGMVARATFGPLRLTAGNSVAKDGWVTHVQVAFDPPLGTGLKVTREGALSGVGKLFGAQDVELGDAAFDGLFIVKAKDVDKARTVLVPEARTRLVNLREAAAEVTIDDACLVVTVPRLVDDSVTLTRLVTDAREAAEAMIAFRSPASQAPFR